MISDASEGVSGLPPSRGACPAGGMLIDALNAGGCEAKRLASLMEVLSGHLDQAGEVVDPVRISELAADVTRISQGLAARLSIQMFAAEERCCSVRLPPAA